MVKFSNISHVSTEIELWKMYDKEAKDRVNRNDWYVNDNWYVYYGYGEWYKVIELSLSRSKKMLNHLIFRLLL